ncbi:MAG: universal stress protein [Rhizomicrobium sp.]
MTKILVATDGSPSADRAVDLAARIAADMRSELIIVTAMQLVVDYDLEKFAQAEHTTTGDILERDAAATLKRAQARAAKLGVTRVEALTKIGDPAEIILNLAKDIPADMVVMGKRGHGRLEGLLLGSVSQKSVSLAQCPVLVVP